MDVELKKKRDADAAAAEEAGDAVEDAVGTITGGGGDLTAQEDEDVIF